MRHEDAGTGSQWRVREIRIDPVQVPCLTVEAIEIGVEALLLHHEHRTASRKHFIQLVDAQCCEKFPVPFDHGIDSC